MATTDLEYLLLQGQKLCKDIDTFKPVSKIHKSLRQLCRNANYASEQLLNSNDEQCAKEFLANRGLDLSNYSNVLNRLCTHRDNVVTPCDPKPVMDYSSSVESLMGRHIEDYISNLEANDTNKADHYLQDLPSSWKTIKKCTAYSEFASDSYDVSFCLQNLPGSKNKYFTFDPSLSGPDESEHFPFVADVHNYIGSIENNKPNKELIDYFIETVHKRNFDATTAHIWNVVNYMYNITPQQQSPYGSFSERFSIENQIKLVKNAKSYLEDKYQSFLIKETRHLNITNDNNYMASVISSYVFINTGRTATQENDFNVDEQSIWPLLYFSLRCGRIDVAKYFVNKSGLALDDLLNVFIHLKEANFTERVGSNVGVMLNKYYRTLRVYDNAFRKTIFSLLGMVEANVEKKFVAKTIEDKLWILLVEHFASKYMEDSNGLDYCSLQRYVLDHGKPYKEQPHVYFELLFLIGQFESAIDFLYRSVNFSYHAVHIAIALYEKNLLATPEHLQAPFLSNENVDVKFVRLNFSRLILLFCNEFESNHPHYATYYYYFLRNLKSPVLNENLFHKCVADLATSFDGNMCDCMFGCSDSMTENSISSGILHKTFGLNNISAIIDKTLELSLDKNKLEVAFKLYNMRSDKAAFGVLNNILSSIIYNFDVTSYTVKNTKSTNINKNFYERVYLYSEELNKKKITSSFNAVGPMLTFDVLRNMYLFFYYSSHQQFLCAVEKAIDTGLVPFSSDDGKHCLNNCTKYGEIVRRNIYNFIKSLVWVLCEEYNRILKNKQVSMEQDSLIEEEDSDIFDQSKDIGWTKQRIRKTIKIIYLYAAQLPVYIALDVLEYISKNTLNIQLD